METTTRSTITLFFSIVNTINHAFSPVMNKSLSAMFVKICSTGGDLLCLSPLLKCTSPCCVNIHSLVSTNFHQVSVNMSGCNFFSAWRNSITYLCSIGSPMSDAVLSVCSSSAICHTATKCNRILVGRFSPYCHHLLLT